MIFGENLIVLLVLALGAALAVGNALALLRPRDDTEVAEGELARPPAGRSLAMIALGVIAAVWAIASLLTAPDEPATAALTTQQPVASAVVL